MSKYAFNHSMQYALRMPMCTKEQLQFELNVVEHKVQELKSLNTDAYVASRR